MEYVINHIRMDSGHIIFAVGLLVLVVAIVIVMLRKKKTSPTPTPPSPEKPVIHMGDPGFLASIQSCPTGYLWNGMKCELAVRCPNNKKWNGKTCVEPFILENFAVQYPYENTFGSAFVSSNPMHQSVHDVEPDAPSSIDATLVSPGGAWDTNRNPTNFPTNVPANFPFPGVSKTMPAWKAKATPRGVAAYGGFGTAIIADPPVGAENTYDGVFGSA